MKTGKWVVAAALAGAAAPIFAHHGVPSGHAVAQVAQATQGAQGAQPDAGLAQGEVRKIDRANRKLTIKHGEIRNLDMPPMTMVFQASDAKLLDGLKVGDKVTFRAAKVDGHYAVTEIEPSR
ncbi:MAG TPA: copper-binding protein [Burkholderiaceae bacterium]|jgi:Cu/Ag efflux protein CusF|nr:copper-binding protein [Burkholderiaceae bacterium]